MATVTRKKTTKSATNASSSGTRRVQKTALPIARSKRISSNIADVQTAATARAKLFQNGRSQAVRIPKEFRFEGKEVQVSRQGDGLLLMPVVRQSPRQYWSKLFQDLDNYKHLDFPDCEDDTITEPEAIFPEDW